MMVRISELSTLQDFKIRARFDNGRVVIYDVGEDIRGIPAFAPLKEVAGLFNQVHLDASRTCVYWNDTIDLPSDTIYEYGREAAPSR